MASVYGLIRCLQSRPELTGLGGMDHYGGWINGVDLPCMVFIRSIRAWLYILTGGRWSKQVFDRTPLLSMLEPLCRTE